MTIDGYVIDRLLGRGGMGAVYGARQVPSGRRVAIKLLSQKLQSQPGYVAQFESEARLQAKLRHRHIVPVLDGGKVDGKRYLVLRYIDGYNLRELIRARGLAFATTMGLLHDVASALDYAHGRGVLHLDVKPQNILVEGGRRAWLADFGLTRLTGKPSGLAPERGLVGSLDYLAPEIVLGREPSAASDVYALAVTAFEALTGVLPFGRVKCATDALTRARASRPPASDVGQWLVGDIKGVLQRGMAVDPSARHPSAGALVRGLQRALDHSDHRRGERPHISVAAADAARPKDFATSAPTMAPELVHTTAR